MATPSWRSHSAFVNAFNLAVGYFLTACGILATSSAWVYLSLGVFWATLFAAAVAINGAGCTAAQRSLIAAATILMVAFLAIDPLSEMNQSPFHLSVSVVCLAIGGVLSAELNRQGIGVAAFGFMMFWLCATVVFWTNVALLRAIGGKWGAGMWGLWIT